MTYDTPLKAFARKQTLVAVFIIFLFSILISLLIAPVVFTFSQFSIQDSVVGVKAGDWVTYGFFVTNPPTQKEDWIRVQVVNITGTSITYWILLHPSDQPEQNLTRTDDVSNVIAEYKYPYGTAHDGPIFLPGNLSGTDFDAEFVKQAFDFSGNWNYSSAMRTYIGQEREVNMMNFTYVEALPLDMSVTNYREFYWDKITGILFEQRFVQYEPVHSNATISELRAWNDQCMKIADTNLWYVPHPSNTQLPKIVALGTILFGIGVAAVKIRDKQSYEKQET